MRSGLQRTGGPRWPARPSRAMLAARAAAVLVAVTCLGACGGSGAAGGPSGTPGTRPGSQAPSSAAVSSAPAQRRSPIPFQVAPGAGRLPQTMARPLAYGPAFRAMIADLWLAVSTGRASYAWPAFFPVDAYKQVKAIYNPAADWRSRLWFDFVLDVRAAHDLLRPGASAAQLIKVIVPSAQAGWITPGVCYNRVGYWHVAGPRVVYRLHGQVRSFGIASLISWRGVWYVVHFGGVVRGAVGMVDAPAAGPGVPGPPGGC